MILESCEFATHHNSAKFRRNFALKMKKIESRSFCGVFYFLYKFLIATVRGIIFHVGYKEFRPGPAHQGSFPTSMYSKERSKCYNKTLYNFLKYFDQKQRAVRHLGFWFNMHDVTTRVKRKFYSINERIIVLYV